AASDPLVGSVNAHAPIFRPLARSGMYFRFWASLPASQMFPVHRELWAAMIKAWDPQARAIASMPFASASTSRPAPSYPVGIATPRKPNPPIFATVALGNSPVLSTWAATGRTSFSAKSWTVCRIISCSESNSKSIVPFRDGITADGLLGLRFGRFRFLDSRRIGGTWRPASLVAHRPEDVPSFLEQIERRVPPLRRPFDQEGQVEAEPVPDRHEVPGRLEHPLVEGHLDHLLLAPLPLRDHLERPDRGEVVRERLVLDGHDPVLLRIVPRRLDIEVV